MRILARHAVNIVAAVCVVLISSPRLVLAATLSITSPPALGTVSATVPFSCADSAPGATVNLYIDNVYTAGGRSPFSYSWHTTAASNGPHYLVCNGYVNSKTNGGASESVTVRNTNISTVSGVAIQNAVLRATITAIAVNANGTDGATLATTTANNNGQFSLNVPVQSGPVRFRATGGSYISEQNGAPISYPSPLSVLLPSLPGNLSGLSLNPLTTFVDSLAQGNIGRGQNLATALGNATASIEGDYGISTDPSALTPLYTEAAIGTDAGRLGLILGAIVNQDQLACPKTTGGLVGALSSDIFDGIFDGKKSGAAISYCGGKLTAIAGNAQSSDALSGLQQLTLSTRGFSFGGTGNALTLNGVTAAEVSEDVAIIESALVATAPPSVNMFAATTPSMNVARAGATATLLPNGKVLIAGGANGDGNVDNVLKNTELYDPVSNTFAPVASTPVMNTARQNATATLLPNGKVLIAGGFESVRNSLSQVYSHVLPRWRLPVFLYEKMKPFVAFKLADLVHKAGHAIDDLPLNEFTHGPLIGSVCSLVRSHDLFLFL
jgi:Galactose oxidase, central domain